MKSYSLTFLLFLQFLFACNDAASQSFTSPWIADSVQVAHNVQVQSDSVQISNVNRTALASIVYKSTDDGQTWRDISKGLPVARQEDGIRRGDFFANERGFYLVEENWVYHNKPGSNDASWNKEIFPYGHRSIAYANLPAKDIRTTFETSRGTVFVGTNSGIFKSTDDGKNWKQIHAAGRVVESGGVLVATSQKGIIRSTDDGENWEVVISEGGVGIAVERITGGFAAITYNTTLKTRRVRTSYDGGKTWNAIDADLPASPLIASIVQAGEYFYCGHPEGIFRSSDKGKTWKLLFPSKDGQVYNLCVSGNVIYAIPRPGGC